MSIKGIAADPLRTGGAFDDQDMEDLTSHLANLPLGRSSNDGLDLGDNSELLQGNLDRFRALAGDDSHDDLFTSYGGLGLGLGVSDSTIITTTNYPTYGELAAKPPSYEDSIMYEQAPLSMHVAAASGNVMGDDPLSSSGPVPSSSSSSLPQGPLSELLQPPAAAGNGGVAPPSHWPAGAAAEVAKAHTLSGAAAAELPPTGSAAAGGGTAAPPLAALGSGTGARTVRHPSSISTSSTVTNIASTSSTTPAAAAAGSSSVSFPLDSLGLPGSNELRMDNDLVTAPGAHGGVLPRAPSTGASAGTGRGIGGRGGGWHQRMQISVSEPIKREQGGLFGIKGGFVTYLVRAKGRVGSSRSETAVRRRFREFVALAELLKEKYRGYFVPPRPEKNAMEGPRMTDVFVEERRIALERYLNKLARHPVIGASEELRLFLEVDGELADCNQWLALRPPNAGGSVLEGTAKFSKQILGLDRAVTDPIQAAQPTKKATDFMRAIKETARSMQMSAPSASSLPPDEVALVRVRDEVEALQGALTASSRAAEKLVSRLDRWSVVHGEMGLSLVQIRNAEKAEGVALAHHTGTLKQSGNLMHDTERLGTALIRSSRIGRKVTGRCAIELGSLHEYLGLMPAALKGLRARDKALLTADTLQSDLESRRRAIGELEAAGAKVLGGDAAKAKKVADLSGDVAVLEQSVVAARARYERIKEINQQEMSRIRTELRADMLYMLHHYAAIMSACSQRNLEIWMQAAEELQATPEQLHAAKACLVGSPDHPMYNQEPPQPPPPQPHYQPDLQLQHQQPPQQLPSYTSYTSGSKARPGLGMGMGWGGNGVGGAGRGEYDTHEGGMLPSGEAAAAGAELGVGVEGPLRRQSSYLL